MPKQMTAEQKLTYMTETPLPRLVLSLSVPTIVSMLITSFYNMADTYFVGLIGSASASGAVGVAFPLMAIMQAVGFMFGHGSGNHMARVLGAGDAADARKMAATGFFSAFFVGLAIMTIGLLAAEPLAYALGSTPTIAPYAMEYLGYLMPGAPFLIASLVLNNQLRFQGSAFYAMIGITSGAVLNIILDPLFIFTFGMGVAGAALATSLSQVVSFFLLLNGTRLGGNIRIHWRDYTPTLANFREILRGGVPSLARQSLNSLATVCLNLASGGYGDAAIAAMSIVTRVMMMTVSAIIGFGQGFQPICGFNYGAGLYERVRRAFWFCVRLCFCVLVVVSAAGHRTGAADHQPVSGSRPAGTGNRYAGAASAMRPHPPVRLYLPVQHDAADHGHRRARHGAGHGQTRPVLYSGGMGAGACLWPPGRAAGTASGRCAFLPAGHSADAAGFAQAARERGCKKSFKDVNVLPSFSVLSVEALSAMPRACGEGGEMPVKLGIVSYITQVLR